MGLASRLRRPIRKGDTIEHGTGIATVLNVLPYTGRYPQWFNTVLVLSSTQTRSGMVERAWDDPVLRKQQEPKP